MHKKLLIFLAAFALIAVGYISPQNKAYEKIDTTGAYASNAKDFSTGGGPPPALVAESYGFWNEWDAQMVAYEALRDQPDSLTANLKKLDDYVPSPPPPPTTGTIPGYTHSIGESPNTPEISDVCTCTKYNEEGECIKATTTVHRRWVGIGYYDPRGGNFT